VLIAAAPAWESPDKPKTQSLFVFVAAALSVPTLRTTTLALLLLVDQTLDIIRQRLQPNQGPVPLVLLLQDVRVLEVVLELGRPLDARVAHLANLVGVELLPSPMMKLAVEILDELGMDEVEERVSDVAVILDEPASTL
jgi:hypothetical protein